MSYRTESTLLKKIPFNVLTSIFGCLICLYLICISFKSNIREETPQKVEENTVKEDEKLGMRKLFISFS